MSTSICFDFGNSRLKAAIFKSNELVEVVILEKADMAEVDALLTKWTPEKTILSSVVHHDKNIETLLAAKSKFHLLGPATKINFTTPVGKPETIGTDRLALVAAAVNLNPNQHNLIISLGTCITYNFVNRQHQFLGGSISPGTQMRFKAMHEQTALLPLVEPDHHFPLIGFDTKTNLQSGDLTGKLSYRLS